ncbi:DNA-3-methyladenine glycosylase [Candidatus Uhrbacteria bacterium]|nr:DNA-3-methyladenine glycosylase [Candidatus Uhrbacteria bacterium]
MSRHGAILPRSFYRRNVVTVAQDLLGMLLVHRVRGQERIGRIVETEAYLGRHDRASHSSRSTKERKAALFGSIGHAYVYLIYGMYECMNVVAEEEGKGAAILLRAVEPVEKCDGKTTGPGLLSRAMGITRTLDGCDLLSKNFYIAKPFVREHITIVVRPRIGVDYASHWAKRLLRFYIKDNPFVSKQ